MTRAIGALALAVFLLPSPAAAWNDMGYLWDNAILPWSLNNFWGGEFYEADVSFNEEVSLAGGIMNMMSIDGPAWLMVELPLYLVVAWAAGTLEVRRRAA